MKTSFRYGIATKRLCDSYNDRASAFDGPKKNAGVLMIIDTGTQCTIAGSGEIYEKFEQTGVVEGYNGCGN